MRILLFGSSGSIGKGIYSELIHKGYDVNCVRHRIEQTVEVAVGTPDYEEFIRNNKFDGIVWAGGINFNDQISTFSEQALLDVIDANLTFILKTLRDLYAVNSLNKGASLVVISSVWNQISRGNKLSYSVSKAAVTSAVRSLAIELGNDKIRVNTVAPGVILNEMTLQNLAIGQIDKIRSETPLGDLINVGQVASVVSWLLSNAASGVTGQNIVVDGGWSTSRYV
jgi:NAD(P)-dependent dehydrogenase (short-subunit alcohol dehydrogenase family)